MRTAGRGSPPVATSRSIGGSSAQLDSSAGLRLVLPGILRLKKILQL